MLSVVVVALAVLLEDDHRRSGRILDMGQLGLALHPSHLGRPCQGCAGQHRPIHRCYPLPVDTLDIGFVVAVDAEPDDEVDKRPAVPSHAVWPPPLLLQQLWDHTDSMGLYKIKRSIIN